MLKPKSRVQVLLNQFNSSLGLPFQKVLPASMIEETLAEEGIKYRNRLFSPLVTLWAFLSQVIDGDQTCHNAVSRVIAWLAGQGKEIPSEDNSGYCQARLRLSENFLKKLFNKSGKNLEKEVQEESLWCGRRVKVFDGSTVSMPDTLKNQKAYPQPTTQKAGCGFPLAKLGVLFSLQTGAAIAIIIEVFKIHDVKLARQLYDVLEPGDIFLSDRACCSYADIYFIKQRNCDAVIRLHQSRKQQMRKKKRIGSNDRLVTWKKPKSKPKGLSKQEYDSLPKTLVVREIHYYICIPGYRTKQVTLITTLLDEKVYPIIEFLKVYEMRWEAELNLRHLKTSLGMDILRGQTPEMVRKEIYVHLLAYNLLRTVMWSAGTQMEVNPLRLSLQEARHHLNHFVGEFKNSGVRKRKKLYQTMLEAIAHKPMKKRPLRFEPRVRKRRPKAYPLMTEPRSILRQKVA